MSTMSFWDFPWPDPRTYCIVLGVVLSAYFGKTLVDAIALSTRVNNNGTLSGHGVWDVVAAYAWNTIVFWAAALGFIAAYQA